MTTIVTLFDENNQMLSREEFPIVVEQMYGALPMNIKFTAFATGVLARGEAIVLGIPSFIKITPTRPLVINAVGEVITLALTENRLFDIVQRLD